ncbi:hypothetical protein QE374_002328 [Microbacterium sp. SORGH_AS428]|uniref:hypothetical protein n=1 Tax=Microbacterium sp. SORGH_AS_0428 TaxID=3041788 RepID=UPI00285985E1|nr:hypothetical protein [Microbacterium sp. SORGH_AS_0428]MDR6200419.1 hypothetical protein [Microbacterium sp. SORGH_AS_0428]
MDALQQFVDDWGRRWEAALVAAVRALPADVVAGRIYAAAIAVADGNTVPALFAHTESRLAEVADADLDPDEAAYFRWWPDESGIEVQSEELAALAAELGEWADAHPEFSADPEDEFAWSDRWIAETDRALIRALGSDAVRRTFAAIGIDPVLVVTETDGDPARASAAFEALNGNRDDAAARDARAFWGAADD